MRTSFIIQPQIHVSHVLFSEQHVPQPAKVSAQNVVLLDMNSLPAEHEVQLAQVLITEIVLHTLVMHVIQQLHIV